MATLPPLSEVLSSPATPDSPLATAMSTLFESSPILLSTLVPQLSAQFQSPSPSSPPPPTTYASLIDRAVAAIAAWDPPARAAFIAAHPRIGQAARLSHLSQQEQAASATPPAVLARLALLNALYERRYPGLRYVTFVNGRSRAEIRDEMEGALGVSADEGDGGGGEDAAPVEVGGRAWTEELERAVVDVGRIAKSRLRALGAV